MPGFWQAAPWIAAGAVARGFIGGAAFATVLGVVYRRRTLHQLDPKQLGLWGALAGLFTPFALLTGAAITIGFPLTPALLGMTLLLYGIPAMATATGTVLVAQRVDQALSAKTELSGLSAANSDEVSNMAAQLPGADIGHVL